MPSGYRPPSRRRRLAVWLVGFVVTGKLFHHVSERDVRRLRPAEFALHASSMCLVLGAVAYVWTVIPREVLSTVFLAAVGVGLGLGAVPILVQWLVTKAMEFQQLR
jgi:hypothetical protein